jgi:para-aminobenzoate synthetase/4-amino-4-deoxychorismate lyase
VAIRTVVIDRTSGEAEYGVGGGIVRDSTSKKEYEECRIKARLLTASSVPFRLLETVLWEPKSGFFLLEHHLKRLADSSDYFSFPLDLESLRDRLRAAEKAFGSSSQKVRITVSANGGLSHETVEWPREPATSSGRICLSRFPVSSSDIFLYHKTTNRRVYENALREHPGCDDVILWNEKGELTESTIANLILETDDGLLTPPIRCGLLAGTYRAWLLETGRVKECVLTANDLKRSRHIYLVNSLRKQWEITMYAEGRHFPDGSLR